MMVRARRCAPFRQGLGAGLTSDRLYPFVLQSPIPSALGVLWRQKRAVMIWMPERSIRRHSSSISGAHSGSSFSTVLQRLSSQTS